MAPNGARPAGAREASLVTFNDAHITADDIAELNRSSLKATATIGRVAGMALMVLGAVGVVAWLWVAARQQQFFGDASGFPFGTADDLSVTRRVDLLVSSFSLLIYAGLVFGVGQVWAP
jgi:hypothetical protein